MHDRTCCMFFLLLINQVNFRNSVEIEVETFVKCSDSNKLGRTITLTSKDVGDIRLSDSLIPRRLH